MYGGRLWSLLLIVAEFLAVNGELSIEYKKVMREAVEQAMKPRRASRVPLHIIAPCSVADL